MAECIEMGGAASLIERDVSALTTIDQPDRSTQYIVANVNESTKLSTRGNGRLADIFWLFTYVVLDMFGFVWLMMFDEFMCTVLDFLICLLAANCRVSFYIL